MAFWLEMAMCLLVAPALTRWTSQEKPALDVGVEGSWCYFVWYAPGALQFPVDGGTLIALKDMKKSMNVTKSLDLPPHSERVANESLKFKGIPR